MRQICVFGLYLVGSILVTGCTSTVTYNSAYEPRAEYPSESLSGKALILTDPSEDMLVLSQSPSSFTGGSTTINVGIGYIIKEVAVGVFDSLFEDGAVSSNKIADSSSYRVVVTPSHGSLDFQYNQIDNLGFAITPKASVNIRVKITNSDGSILIDRPYPSGLVEGQTYAISGSPAEKINEVIHQAVGKALSESARDLRTALD
jgi:hypothetical protein